MTNITRTLYDDDGVVIEPDSERAYRIVVAALRAAYRTLDDASPALPGVLRDEYRAAMSGLMRLAGDGENVADDLRRWDGDHELALAERAFRKGTPRAKKGAAS